MTSPPPASVAPATRPPLQTLWRSIPVMMGSRALRWQGLTVIISLATAMVEMAIAWSVQLFLVTLGIVSTTLARPLPGLPDWKPTPLQVGILLLGIGAARALAYASVNYAAWTSMEALNAQLRRIAVEELLEQPGTETVPASLVNARVADSFIRAATFAHGATSALSAIVEGAALVVVMAATSFRETLVGMAGLSVVGFLVLRVNAATRRVAWRVPPELKALTRGIERIARNISLVRVLRVQRTEKERLVKSIESYERNAVKAAVISNFGAAGTPFFGIVLILVIVGLSLRWGLTSGMILVSFLYLFIRFVQTMAVAAAHVGVCGQYWPQFYESLLYVSSFERPWIDSVFAPAAEPSPSQHGQTANTAIATPPSIEVDDVSFGYQNQGLVIDNVSLTAAPGKRTGIVGPSGSGKSTLLAIILGLLKPSQGRVQIGGRSPREYFQDPAIRAGYVGSEPFLIAGSIRENLLYGNSVGASNDELWKALDQAHLASVVEQLPGKLEYPISEDGSGLSAGQKQRLCLARALANRPHLLVLDEASANLDAKTERDIAETLKNLDGQCTTLIVSHRETLLLGVQTMVELGKVADSVEA